MASCRGLPSSDPARYRPSREMVWQATHPVGGLAITGERVPVVALMVWSSPSLMAQ